MDSRPSRTGSGVSRSHAQATAIVLIAVLAIIGIIWWHWPTKPIVATKPAAVKEQFTIKRGESIATYMGTSAAITTAADNNIPLFKGKITRAKRPITWAQARKVDTNRTQLTALVFTGDTFQRQEDGTYKLVSRKATPARRDQKRA